MVKPIKVLLLAVGLLTRGRNCVILGSIKFVWIFYGKVLLFATQWFAKAIVWLFLRPARGAVQALAV